MRSSGIHSVKDATPAGIDAQLLHSGQSSVCALPALGADSSKLTIHCWLGSGTTIECHYLHWILFALFVKRSLRKNAH